MKYDDASWHYGGDFPAGLPSEAGGTHIGMFLAWALLGELAGSLFVEDNPDSIEELRERSSTPGEFFLRTCDEKLTSDDLSQEGNAFAVAYYAPDDSPYLLDYIASVSGGSKDVYFVPDSWETFDRLAPVLDFRLAQFRAGKLGGPLPAHLRHSKRAWWRLW